MPEIAMQITVCPTCRTKLAEWGQYGEGRMYIRCPNCKDVYELCPTFGSVPRLVRKYGEIIFDPVIVGMKGFDP